MSLYIHKRKKVLRKALIGFCLFLIGAVGFFLTHLIFQTFFSSYFYVHPLFAVLMTTLLFVVAYKPLDIAVNQFFRNYLFKHKSYAHMALMNLTEDLSLILDLKELSNLIVNTFAEVLHLKSVALVLPNRLRQDYEIVSASGWHVSDSKRVRLPESAPLVQHIKKGGRHVIVRDRVVRAMTWQDANNLARDFDNLRSSWVIPLFVKDELMGFLAFSAERPDSVFDEADFHFFREFASIIAKYLYNALSVHELEKANAELQDAQAHLLQATKLSAIEQLATGIAHEIHNPLTIISGKAQVLLLQKDRNKMDERVEDVLKTIVKQTKRAADITRKLLMFSQSSGSLKESVNLEQVLQDTIALVSYQTSLEGIEIERRIRRSIPKIEANVHEIREVFLNLILNAVQSIGSQGKIVIEMNDHPQDKFIEISISDTGPGISPEHLEKLFNPFFTTRHEAIGLGLFITKQIVHRYGGSIRVESQADSGTLFILKFPYQRSPEMVLIDKGEITQSQESPSEIGKDVLQ